MFSPIHFQGQNTKPRTQPIPSRLDYLDLQTPKATERKPIPSTVDTLDLAGLHGPALAALKSVPDGHLKVLGSAIRQFVGLDGISAPKEGPPSLLSLSSAEVAKDFVTLTEIEQLLKPLHSLKQKDFLKAIGEPENSALYKRIATHTDLHSLLNKYGANLPSKEEIDQAQLDLEYAASRGDVDVVKKSLKILGVDSNGIHWLRFRTPLMDAAREGHLEVVQTLLAAPGTDVNRTTYNKNALMEAVEGNRLEIVKLLLDVPGIKLNTMNSRVRKTALDYANSPEMRALLSQHKILTGSELMSFEASLEGIKALSAFAELFTEKSITRALVVGRLMKEKIQLHSEINTLRNPIVERNAERRSQRFSNNH